MYIVCVVPLKDQSFEDIMCVTCKGINRWTNPMGNVQRTNSMGHAILREMMYMYVTRNLLHVQDQSYGTVHVATHVPTCMHSLKRCQV